MKYSDFEKHIQNTLKNKEYKVDTTALIDAIQPIAQNDKRGILLPLTFLFLAATSFYFLYPSAETKINTEQNEIQLKPRQQTPISESFLTKSDAEKKNIYSDDITTKPSSRINIPSKSFHKKREQITNMRGRKQNINLTSGLNKPAYTSNKKLDSSLNLTKSHSLLKTLLNSILTKKITPIKLSPVLVFNNDKVKCPSFQDGKWNTAFGVHAGVFYPFKTLSIKSNEISEIFEYRLANEKSLEGLNGGVWFQIQHHKSPIYLKFGVDYSKLTEKLTLNTTIETLDTTQGIISIVASENGDTLTVIKGDIITERTIHKKAVAHYNIQMLDIPLNLGYQFKTRNWNFGFEAGVQLNIFTQVKGRILNKNQTINNISDNTGFVKKIGLSYSGNIILEKPLNFGAISLLFKYRYIPTNFSTSDIKQNYYFDGVNLGYKIYF